MIRILALVFLSLSLLHNVAHADNYCSYKTLRDEMACTDEKLVKLTTPLGEFNGRRLLNARDYIQAHIVRLELEPTSWKTRRRIHRLQNDLTRISDANAKTNEDPAVISTKLKGPLEHLSRDIKSYLSNKVQPDKEPLNDQIEVTNFLSNLDSLSFWISDICSDSGPDNKLGDGAAPTQSVAM